MSLLFENYTLDTRRRELRRGRDLIALEPKVFDLLIFLVKHRDRVVSKDDLLQAVWDGRIVSESALTTRINALRRALDDDGATQRLVRTFARKGVRFVGEATEIPDEPASLNGRGASSADLASISVLPFQNLSNDPEQDYFAIAMAEEITIAIARLPWLIVTTCSMRPTYRSDPVDVMQAAHELGVRYLLKGSIRKSGERVRITGELLESATGAHIWGERFDGTRDDIFELQDRVAAGVAGAVEPRLRLAEIARAARKPTERLDAYDLYLRAHAEVLKRTREGMTASVRLARQALAIDPDFAPAMARLAISQMMRWTRHWIPDGPETEEGVRMAWRAISTGRHDPMVLDFAGLVLAQLAGDNEAALSAIDRALAISPNFATAHGHRALVLAYLNRPHEAIEAAHRAMRLSPLDPAMFAFYSALGLAHLALGEYEEAVHWAEEAFRENSGLPALRLKLSALGHLGRVEEISEWLRRVREVHAEPTIAALSRELPRGLAREIADRYVEGFRKAGLPEE